LVLRLVLRVGLTGRGSSDATGRIGRPPLLHAQTGPRRTPHSPVPLSADTSAAGWLHGDTG